MKTITIDITPAIHQSAGIGRLTRESVRALLALPSPHCFTTFCMGQPPAAVPQTLAVQRSAPLTDRWFHRIWFRAGIRLPVDIFAGRSDLYHATDFILPPTVAHKTVLTVHDLTFERDPESAVPSLLRFLKRVVPASARKASHIIADSFATADDLVSLYGLPRAKITTIHSGVDARFTPQPARSDERHQLRARHNLGDEKVILTVGTMQRRKNHLGLIEAFAPLANEALLTISGGKGWLYDDVLARVQALGLQERVRFLGYTPDEDLPALYRACDVFAFPSLYEGFGLPPLEAMASGVPVVTSNVSSLPEVVGDTALTIAPRDTAALTAALRQALHDDAWRAQAAARGLERARSFTWEKAARALHAVYDQVLNTPALPASL